MPNRAKILLSLLAILPVLVLTLGAAEAKEPKQYDYTFSFIELWQKKYVPAPPKDAYLLLNCSQVEPIIRYNIRLGYDTQEKQFIATIDASGSPQFRLRYYRPEKLEYTGDSGWLNATVEVGISTTQLYGLQAGKYEIVATVIEKVAGKAGQFIQRRTFKTIARYDEELNKATMEKWTEQAQSNP